MEEEVCFCPLYGLIDVIAKKWSLLIIAVLGNEGAKGFNELQRELKGISPKVLSKTLRELEEHGLITREIISTRPPRVKYSLSESGWELRSLLIPLLKWVSKRGGRKATWCPIRLVHEKQKLDK
ncbi:MAG: transcriptional regulator [Thermoprotei archaeon]|nr:MAG: transcriptional regulator [Thermoprotei archaeon]